MTTDTVGKVGNALLLVQPAICSVRFGRVPEPTGTPSRRDLPRLSACICASHCHRQQPATEPRPSGAECECTLTGPDRTSASTAPALRQHEGTRETGVEERASIVTGPGHPSLVGTLGWYKAVRIALTSQGYVMMATLSPTPVSLSATSRVGSARVGPAGPGRAPTLSRPHSPAEPC